MAHFCALLSIDFKVCRLITETFSDIRKTVTNRLFSSPFQSLRGKNQEVLRQRVHAARCAVANFAVKLATVCENKHTY